jgi:hypothetical protein
MDEAVVAAVVNIVFATLCFFVSAIAAIASFLLRRDGHVDDQELVYVADMIPSYTDQGLQRTDFRSP